MLNKLYTHIEHYFEKLTAFITAVLGNSVTFMLALCVVIFWLIHDEFRELPLHEQIGDLILGITFLSLFIIQKSFNRFSALLHLKINELVFSQASADNSVLNLSEKTEREITILTAESHNENQITEEPEEPIRDNI